MTITKDQSLPDTGRADSATSDELADTTAKVKWLRLALCCGVVVVGIPFLAVLGLIAYVLINHFFVQR